MDPNKLDPQAFNLARAIKRAETGGSVNPYNTVGDNGTSRGAYQFQNNTWKDWSKRHLGFDNAPMTVENQNKVAYSQIKEWKDQGLTPAQIASKWNSGKENAYQDPNYKGRNEKLGIDYDVPGYVAKVSKYYNELRGNQQETPSEQPAPVQEGGAPFKYDQNDSPLEAGAKALGNLPSSALGFAQGAVQSINPLNIAKTAGEIGSGFSELEQVRGTGGALWDVIKGLPKAAYQSLVPQGVRSLISGDTQEAAKQFTEDPFGQSAPLVLSALGGAKALDRRASSQAMSKYVDQPYTQRTIPQPVTKFSDAVDTVISKTGQVVTKPIGAIVQAPAKLASQVSKSITSNLVGLEPDSISQILSNPREYSRIAQDQATRGNLAGEFGRAIDKIEETLQETGEAYNPIRQTKIPVVVPKGFVDSVLSEFGLKVKNGKVTADSKSITRNVSDINALNNFYKNWGSKTVMTPSEYLNMRKDIAGIAKFGKEIGTNIDAQKVGTKLYERANQKIRPQIKGLKELDDQFSPQKKQFDQIKKDFLQKTPDGDYAFKDGAVNKIANAANKGKDSLLARMEEVMPGVTKKIEILKTVEDIQKAYGNKVGTYARGVVGGGALITGNLAGILGAIIANPSIAVPLLRSLGYTAEKIGPIIAILKMIAGDVNKTKVSSPLSNTVLLGAMAEQRKEK